MEFELTAYNLSGPELDCYLRAADGVNAEASVAGNLDRGYAARVENLSESKLGQFTGCLAIELREAREDRDHGQQSLPAN